MTNPHPALAAIATLVLFLFAMLSIQSAMMILLFDKLELDKKVMGVFAYGMVTVLCGLGIVLLWI